jgi:hypothetical protein
MMLRKPNVTQIQQPRTWKVMDRHLNPRSFTEYNKYINVASEGKNFE